MIKYKLHLDKGCVGDADLLHHVSEFLRKHYLDIPRLGRHSVLRTIHHLSCLKESTQDEAVSEECISIDEVHCQ